MKKLILLTLVTTIFSNCSNKKALTKQAKNGVYYCPIISAKK